MALIPLLLLIGAFAVLWMKTIRSKKHPPLPPGPPAEPIIGHLRVIPSENQESVFHEWGKVYGASIIQLEPFPIGMGQKPTFSSLREDIPETSTYVQRVSQRQEMHRIPAATNSGDPYPSSEPSIGRKES
ncbi:hypothetical protein H0H81_000539 [Sphagnurus paluster]|uniref:Uncharacterized protein n=1 Tax=Sphagnurus paluster TaxID=117069 RepID=A0A9P7GGD8_9AGAR|nr:hypothetical protein H0H81_000539 [Sphagnurus paluster]